MNGNKTLGLNQKSLGLIQKLKIISEGKPFQVNKTKHL